MPVEPINAPVATVQPVTLPGTPGNPIPANDPNANPAVQTSNITSPDNVVAMIEKARQDEKAKLYGTIEKTKAEAKAQADALEAANRRVKELEALTNKDLTSDQRLAKQIADLQADIANERKMREESDRQSQARLRQTELDSYKHRRLAEVGINTLLPDLVGGDSPEMIDASILVAQAERVRLREQFFTEFQAQHGMNGGQGDVPSAAGVPGVPSQHFTPQVPNGFPTQVNPVPVVQESVDLATLSAMTSEEAVRSGQYEQVRASLLANLKKSSPGLGGQVLGATPRHMGPSPTGMPMADIGGGVMQPTGFPTGPVRPTQLNQNATIGNQQGNDARAQAIAAVNRTHAGQNPLLASQQGKAPPGPIPQGDASAASAAFANRFNPTPPVQ